MSNFQSIVTYNQFGIFLGGVQVLAHLLVKVLDQKTVNIAKGRFLATCYYLSNHSNVETSHPVKYLAQEHNRTCLLAFHTIHVKY